jgi:hypothetical protein
MVSEAEIPQPTELVDMTLHATRRPPPAAPHQSDARVPLARWRRVDCATTILGACMAAAALLVDADLLFISRRVQLANLTVKHGLITMLSFREQADVVGGWSRRHSGTRRVPGYSWARPGMVASLGRAAEALIFSSSRSLQSSGWMWISQPSWSTNQTETGLVELSIQDSLSMAKGSGSV